MLLRGGGGGYDEKSGEMACNWLMMTSSGDNNGRVGVWVCSPTKLKIPKAEQETAQPTAARFKKNNKINRRQRKKPPSLWLGGLMRKILCSPSLTFDSALVKYGV